MDACPTRVRSVSPCLSPAAVPRQTTRTGERQKGGKMTTAATTNLAGSKTFWMTAALVWLFFINDAQANRDCKDSDVAYLMQASSECQKPLSNSTKSALAGQLTKDDKPATCQKYSNTMTCLTKLKKECTTESVILEDIMNDLEMGIGQLCTNQNAFKKYLSFANCYSTQRNVTLNCTKSFSLAVDNVYREGEPLCLSLDKLVNCTAGDAIEPNCGSKAANVFVHILLTNIPSVVFHLCPEFRDSLAPYPSSDAPLLSSLSGLSLFNSITTVTLFSTFWISGF